MIGDDWTLVGDSLEDGEWKKDGNKLLASHEIVLIIFVESTCFVLYVV